MNIQDYTLTELEEDRVRIILEMFRAVFPNTRIDERKSIIGIGEEGRHLFCYFARVDGKTCVKFKNRTFLDLEDATAILTDAEMTIALFKEEPFAISRHPKEEKKTGRRRRRKKTVVPPKTMESAHPAGRLDAEFNTCSHRLRFALYNAQIFTVQDLLSYTPWQIQCIKNLGRASFRELCAFLDERFAKDAVFSPCTTETGWELNHRQDQHALLEKLEAAHRPLPLRTEDIRTDFSKDEETFALLWQEIKDHILSLAAEKLSEDKQDMFRARLGLDRPPMTLQAIGEIYGVTRERIRQKVNKAVRRVGSCHIATVALVALEQQKLALIERVKALTAGAFLSYLISKDTAASLIQFVATYYLYIKVDIASFEKQYRATLLSRRRDMALAQKMQAHNEKVYADIRFPYRRPITEADFSRLRSAAPDNEASIYLFQGEGYPYATALERTILHRFLINNTFKRIRTHALRIPLAHGFYSPSFQCLTHDDHLVIVDVLPFFHMSVHQNIEKFEALKRYCETYGFGYLITDDRWHSFEACADENPEFSAAILQEIAQNGCVTFPRYTLIHKQTAANDGHMLALVKNHNLHLSLPFLLKK